MAQPRNCWEVRNCGREPGGTHTAKLGICPAATETRLGGCNRGSNGGRACWVVPGTDCFPTRSVGEKFAQCLHCSFFQQVDEEEGRNFEVMGELRGRLRGPEPDGNE